MLVVTPFGGNKNMSINEIKFCNYLFDDDHYASNEDIINVESKLGVKFPEEYLNIVKTNQGKIFENREIKFNDQIEGIGTLFTFDDNDEDKNNSYSLIYNHWVSTSSNIPNKIIPFTDAGGSNSTFCFDYRNSEINPKIIFIDSDYEFEDEDAVFNLANNFTEFLGMLYKSTDND